MINFVTQTPNKEPMNVFNNLSQENQCDEDEIKTKNQLRNCRKRLKKLEAKDTIRPHSIRRK